jgi:hypothetical protein
MLSTFTHFPTLLGVNRGLLNRFLRENHSHLPPPAHQLLSARGLDDEEFCRAWAEQFKTAHTFGLPLYQALLDIEALASPENEDLLLRTLNSLPPEYSSITQYEHRLCQSVQLLALEKA